jgi:hypothetical protein
LREHRRTFVLGLNLIMTQIHNDLVAELRHLQKEVEVPEVAQIIDPVAPNPVEALFGSHRMR